MKFVFLGDVHAHVNRCIDISKTYSDSTVIQIGDLGVGWFHNDAWNHFPSNFRFFVGNHDNRTEANTLPHCLGDYGTYMDKFFFVSGANSVDKARRIEGVNWWPNEELTYQQANDCLRQWEKSKVDVLVSHDCPQSFAEKYMLIYDKSLTRNLLQAMIEIRKPAMIISGHHHKMNRSKCDGIDWKELGIDEAFSIDIL